MLPVSCSYGFWQKTKETDGGHKMWIALTNAYLWDEENSWRDIVQTWSVLRQEMKLENLSHWVQTKDTKLVMWCKPQDDLTCRLAGTVVLHQLGLKSLNQMGFGPTPSGCRILVVRYQHIDALLCLP